MGMRIPDLWGCEMSIDIKRETPADAPPVRNMWFGSEGYPSRSVQAYQCQCRLYAAGLVLTFNELGDSFANKENALAVGVRAYRPNFFSEFCSTRQHVLGECIWGQLGELRPFHKSSDLRKILSSVNTRSLGTHLSRESDGRLVQSLLLRVPDIGRDNLVERQSLAMLELNPILF